MYIISSLHVGIFYGKHGLQANGTITHTSSVSSIEDCYRVCNMTATCQSFNTIQDNGTKAYRCELLSDDLCDLDTDTGISKNPLASVYFITKMESCFSFKIYAYGRCLKLHGSDDLYLTDNVMECLVFTKDGTTIQHKIGCIYFSGSSFYHIGQVPFSRCEKFVFTGDQLSLSSHHLGTYYRVILGKGGNHKLFKTVKQQTALHRYVT